MEISFSMDNGVGDLLSQQNYPTKLVEPNENDFPFS